MNHLETACKDPPIPEPAPAMWRARLHAREDEVSMVYRVPGMTCTGWAVTPQTAVRAAAPYAASGFGGPASPSSGDRANGVHRQGVASGPPVPGKRKRSDSPATLPRARVRGVRTVNPRSPRLPRSGRIVLSAKG